MSKIPTNHIERMAHAQRFIAAYCQLSRDFDLHVQQYDDGDYGIAHGAVTDLVGPSMYALYRSIYPIPAGWVNPR